MMLTTWNKYDGHTQMREEDLEEGKRDIRKKKCITVNNEKQKENIMGFEKVRRERFFFLKKTRMATTEENHTKKCCLNRG